MKENKDMVFQEIKKLVNDNGYDCFRRDCGPRKAVLYLEVQSRDDGYSRQLVVTIASSRFMITFAEANAPQYCGDLDQMLNIIKNWLLNGEIE